MNLIGIMFEFEKCKWIVKEIKNNRRCIAYNTKNGDIQKFNVDFIKYKTLLEFEK